MHVIVNIIGAGKLGKTLARLIVKNNLAKIGGVYNRSRESAEQAILFIGEGRYYPEISALPLADITFITTPDDKIEETSLALCQAGNIKPGSVFVHCSGVLTSDVIAAVKSKAGLVASVHPMRSFAPPQLSVEDYAGTYCAMEGDAEALKIIAPLFRSFGSILYPINKDKKALYHAAGVFASNYLVTLAQEALSCLRDSGVEEAVALKLIISLMQGSLSNLEQTQSPKAALTGPIKRGDVATIEKHLSAFAEDSVKGLYATLGKATLALTDHDAETKVAIIKALTLVSK